jgi:lipoprotein-anchoring transpeptidase ErfK/SrfK
VGKNKTVDPTLVDEKQLLKDEAQKGTADKEVAPPKVAPEPPKPAVPEPPKEPSLEELFPLYGAAFQFHTQFRAEPKMSSRVIGYSRRGAKFRVSERISTLDCKNGWYEIAPGGLFACANQGIIVGKTEVSFAPSPPSPYTDRSLPYRYAYVTVDDTPEYWRIPTDTEITSVQTLFAKTPTVDTDTSIVQKPAAAAVTTAAVDDRKASDTAGKVESDDQGEDLPKAAEAAPDFPDYLHLRMAKGYYVSLDDSVKEGGKEYTRTVRGRFIPGDRLAPADIPDYEGFLISDPAVLPQVIIVGSGANLLKQKTPNGPLETGDKVAHLARFDYLGEIKRNNKTFIQVGDGQFVSARVATVVRMQDLPKDLRQNERWIDVDLGDQVLIAYEGERPVFATVVSTGRDGFPTPKGEFHIYAKHVTVTMDDTEAGAEAYSIEDVPWVQYFKDSFALHGAFWHKRFGRVRSHGCVNLSPKDAKRLFQWTGPSIPPGVHGRFATKVDPGTRVVIHD